MDGQGTVVSLPEIIVVMGVSGAGKSTVGTALAAFLHRTFIDADDLHPAANKAKMAAGIPLDDHDRGPWLDAVADAARIARPTVVACSALKRDYRSRLAAGPHSVAFIELDVERSELETRLSARSHEFMSPALLASQLETLEPLSADEPGIHLPYAAPRSSRETAQLAVAALEAKGRNLRSARTRQDA